MKNSLTINGNWEGNVKVAGSLFLGVAAAAPCISGTAPATATTATPQAFVAPDTVAGTVTPIVFADTLSQRYSESDLALHFAARAILLRLVRSASDAKLDRWALPAVNLGGKNEIEAEWWRGKKSLSLTLGPEMTYIRSWGSNIDTEMEDGPFKVADLAKHWQWLLS